MRRTPRPLVLEHVHVIDATGASAKADRAVCLMGGCIEAIEPAGRLPIPAGGRVVDAGGAFLIPGLWDMHVHLAQLGESALPLFIANGVTTVRDVSAWPDPPDRAGWSNTPLDALRRRIEAGVLIGPRILAPGRSKREGDWMDDLRRRASLTFPGFTVHDELELLVRRIGWTPLQAIVGLTRAPAEHFGLQRELGTIEPGKMADLVLLEGDPLQDIRQTRRIRAVVRGGRLIERGERVLRTGHG
jgi:imidazolonepropionase-like amidohydrolase